MSDAIERLKIGDKRTVKVVLEPATYDLCKNGEHIVLKRKCVIEKFQVFQYANGVAGTAAWKDSGYDIGTLAVLPSRWERLRGWLTGREVIPRAIVVTR